MKIYINPKANDKQRIDMESDENRISDLIDGGLQEQAEIEAKNYAWDILGEEDGEGSFCCGKRMVEQGVTFTCLKCGSWCYSSS